MIGRPRQNRVTPFGTFEAIPTKGMFLGNRGDIHASDGGLSNRQWAVKAWICCTLTPKSGNRIKFDRKGTYYPLFFTDEAAAFASGHRPCAMCRHQDYQRFKRYWLSAKNIADSPFVSAAGIDGELHAARVDSSRRKITFDTPIGQLPDGAMFVFPTEPSEARLLWRGKDWRWSHAGYDDGRVVRTDTTVRVLTPAPLIDILKAGYRPSIHPSVNSP